MLLGTPELVDLEMPLSSADVHEKQKILKTSGFRGPLPIDKHHLWTGFCLAASHVRFLAPSGTLAPKETAKVTAIFTATEPKNCHGLRCRMSFQRISELKRPFGDMNFAEHSRSMHLFYNVM